MAEERIAQALLPILQRRFRGLKRDLRRANLRKRIKKNLSSDYPSLLWKADDIDWDSWINDLVDTLSGLLADVAHKLLGTESTFWSSRGETMPTQGWDPNAIVANYKTRIDRYGRSLSDIGTETEQKVRDSLIDWYNQPEKDFAALTNSLQTLFSPERAQLIAQTEVSGIAAEVNYEMMNHFGITQWRWDSFSDNVVCQICQSLNGQTFDVEDQDAFPPNHPGCRCGQFFLVE